MRILIGALGLFAAVLTLGTLAAQNEDRVVLKKPHSSKGTSSGGTQILYHNGPILSAASVPAYIIYYGNFGTPQTVNTQAIINDFLSGLSNTAPYKVNTTYCNASTTTCASTPGATSVSGALSFSTSNIFDDPGSQGAQINSNGLIRILQYAFQHSFPIADNGMYFVITAPDVKVGGFCSSFCAYHTRSTGVVAGHTIHYALVPDPSQKCTACDGNFALGDTVTPNGDAGADEVVDSMFHELSEMVTDPDLNAWYTSNGEENGDLCNYVYGTTSVANGAQYNASWNGRNFLIQLIWKNGPLPQSCAAAP